MAPNIGQSSNFYRGPGLPSTASSQRDKIVNSDFSYAVKETRFFASKASTEYNLCAHLFYTFRFNTQLYAGVTAFRPFFLLDEIIYHSDEHNILDNFFTKRPLHCFCMNNR